MSLGKRAKDAAAELVKQAAAREMLAAINKWRNARISTASKRWIFELIQNAVDAGHARGRDNISIAFSYDEKSLTFKHNAGHFTFAEIDSLIYGTSSKPWGPESEYLGRFGTGFLVSHIVSTDVKINGVLKDKDGAFGFNLHIDRAGCTIENICNCIDSCFEQLNSATKTIETSETWTTYTYTLNDKLGQEAVLEGINQLKQNVTLILNYNQIKEISVGEIHYSKNSKLIGEIKDLAVGDMHVFSLSSENNQVTVSILCENKEIVDMLNRPPIFVGMPLTDSADYIRLPFTINAKFEPTPDRDSLDNKHSNEEFLVTALDLYNKLIGGLLDSEEGKTLQRIFRIVQYQPVPENEEKQNPLWNFFNTQLSAAFKKIASEIPLVRTNSGLTTIDSCVFPCKKFDGGEMDDKNFIKFCDLVRDKGSNVPVDAELSDWIAVVEQLQKSLQGTIVSYSITDLKNDIEKSNPSFCTFEAFGSKLRVENPAKFLLDLYKLIDLLYIAKLISQDFAKSFIPSQDGSIGPISGEYTETKKSFQLKLEDSKAPLSNELKDIAESIGWSLRGELVHQDYSNFTIMKDYVRDVISTSRVIEELTSKSEYSLPVKVSEEEKKAKGWIDLFIWCAINSQLTNGFQVITKSHESFKIENIDKEAFVLPFKLMGIDSKFEEIYPDTKILSSNYFLGNATKILSTIEGLKKYKAFVLCLPLYRFEIFFPFEKLKSVLQECGEVSKVDHSIVCKEPPLISYIPLWNEVIGRISEFRERAMLLFDFVIEYLARNDKNWGIYTKASCSCKGEFHSIIPSYWLASLKTDLWVPIRVSENGVERSVKTSASKESIEGLFEPGKFEVLMASDPETVMNLLPHFHFDRLDLKIKLHSLRTGKRESSVRDGASTLVELVGVVDPSEVEEIMQHPGAFHEVVEEMKKTEEDRIKKEENKIIGENIQMIMLKIIKNAGLRLFADMIYVGGDIEIWPVSSEGLDYGEIEIIPYTVEVKSTSGARVHLSKAQSVRAQEAKENYVVLVVEDTGLLREQLKTPMSESEVSDEIIDLLVKRSHVLEDIHLKLANSPNPEEVEADINGYWIKKKTWVEKKDLPDWLSLKFKSG